MESFGKSPRQEILLLFQAVAWAVVLELEKENPVEYYIAN